MLLYFWNLFSCPAFQGSYLICVTGLILPKGNVRLEGQPLRISQEMHKPVVKK